MSSTILDQDIQNILIKLTALKPNSDESKKLRTSYNTLSDEYDFFNNYITLASELMDVRYDKTKMKSTLDKMNKLMSASAPVEVPVEDPKPVEVPVEVPVEDPKPVEVPVEAPKPVEETKRRKFQKLDILDNIPADIKAKLDSPHKDLPSLTKRIVATFADICDEKPEFLNTVYTYKTTDDYELRYKLKSIINKEFTTRGIAEKDVDGKQFTKMSCRLLNVETNEKFISGCDYIKGRVEDIFGDEDTVSVAEFTGENTDDKSRQKLDRILLKYIKSDDELKQEYENIKRNLDEDISVIRAMRWFKNITN